MKKQVFNPYLPSYEYIPDGEPHVFGDRLYVYGSHDSFDGKGFCLNDYVAWSCPIEDLTDWRYEGIIYKKIQHPGNEDGKRVMYAPDVAQGPDGRFYLYYGLADDMAMGVAVCDSPAGQYEFLDFVKDKNGTPWGQGKEDFMPFDPGILVDDDGKIHLYAGQGPMFKAQAKHDLKRHFRDTAWHVELEADMVTMKAKPTRLLPNLTNSKATGYEGHEFFEANSIRKFNGKYYFIYSSVQSHELVYAVSDKPDRGFTFGGVLTSNVDLRNDCDHTFSFTDGTSKELHYYGGNNHGSVVYVNGQYYVFGHRHTNRSQFSRQGYADPIIMTKDGHFLQAERTSCGLNGGPLAGIGIYDASICCHLYSRKGACFSVSIAQNAGHPYITQSGEDLDAGDALSGELPVTKQYIANMKSGATAGFKYFSLGQASSIGIRTRGNGHGVMMVRDAETNGNVLACIPVAPAKTWTKFYAAFDCPPGVKALYFTYEGSGSVDFVNFVLKV